MNNCDFVGRIIKKPELRTVNGGSTVAKFTIAISNGKDRDSTFVNLEAWNKTAENIVKFFDKGDPIGLSTDYVVDNYEKDGEKRSFHKFRVKNFYFIPGPTKARQEEIAAGRGNQGSAPQTTTEEVGEDEGDDEIPF